jgi:short-subunit dehydrogenase
MGHDVYYAGKTALVTGASSGIGEAFAKALAAKGANVILVARSGVKLAALADALKAEHGVRADVLVADLSASDGAQNVLNRLIDDARTVDVLVNNAGAGTFAKFVDIPPERLRDHTHLNVVSTVELTRGLLPDMIARGHGAVVNISSSTGFMSLPYAAAYAASKAFILSMTEALFEEVVGSGVKVIAVCPGPTRNGDPDHSYKTMRAPEDVVEAAFGGLRRGAPMVLDGSTARQQALFAKLLPRRTMARLAARMNRPKPD